MRTLFTIGNAHLLFLAIGQLFFFLNNGNFNVRVDGKILKWKITGRRTIKRTKIWARGLMDILLESFLSLIV